MEIYQKLSEPDRIVSDPIECILISLLSLQVFGDFTAGVLCMCRIIRYIHEQ